MRTHPNDRSFKPRLEVLENREMPSTLLGALQAIQNDLNNANSSFSTSFAALSASQTATSTSGNNAILTQYSATSGNWQRMLADQNAINQAGPADINAINTFTYFYSLATGNPSFYFAAVLFVDPQFQSIINQANSTVDNARGNANTPLDFTPNSNTTFGILPPISANIVL